jgi:outer membrane protein OmpA-like peptidoglycan-associated protein
MESEELAVEEPELETSTIVDDIQMVNEMELEESIELIDSYEIDYATDVLEGVEVGKSAEIMANMEVEKAMDIFEDMEIEKAIDIVEEAPVEKAIEFMEDMEVEKAIDIFEDMEIEKAIDIAEGMDMEKMVELTDEMQVEKAIEITEGLGIEKTVEIIEGVEIEKASEIMNGLSQEKADEVVNVLKQKMEEGLSDNAVAIIKTFFSDQIDKKESIIFKRVYFDLNSSDLLMLTQQELLLLIDFLNENQNIKIEVVGHTDITGSWDHNLELSNDRAREVYRFLLDHEVSPQRIIHYGKGSAQPIASNETEEGRTRNRRVEVILLQ